MAKVVRLSISKDRKFVMLLPSAFIYTIPSEIQSSTGALKLLSPSTLHITFKQGKQILHMREIIFGSGFMSKLNRIYSTESSAGATRLFQNKASLDSSQRLSMGSNTHAEDWVQQYLFITRRQRLVGVNEFVHCSLHSILLYLHKQLLYRLMKTEGTDVHPEHKYLEADWDAAARHGLASKIGISSDTSLQYCMCCFHNIHKSPILLSEDPKELEFLGFGLPLYFSFVRHCIFLLLISICCYNIPSLYFALVHNAQFCRTNIDKLNTNSHSIVPHNAKQIRHFLHMSDTKIIQPHSTQEVPSEEETAHEIECTGWMIHLSRIEKELAIEEELIRFSSFFIHLILLVYIRERLTKMKYYFDERSASPSDFAVFIKNMPPQTNQRRELVRVLRWEYGNFIQPIEIYLVPDLKSYQEMQWEKEGLIRQLQKHNKKSHQNTNDTESLKIKALLEKTEDKIKELVLKDRKKYEADQLEAERAIIIFRTQDQKWALIRAFEAKPLQQKAWEHASISEASEPDEIIWQNASYNSSDKAFFKFLGWFLSILTLMLITAIFIVITHFKSDLVQKKIIEFQKKNTQKNYNLLKQAFAIVLGMIFLVVLFNKFVLAHLFHKFTEMEKHSSTYKFQFYFCLKYCLGLFFTTALMTLIIEDFLFNNFFKHNFGVIEEETIMFLFNSVFVPLFWLIHPMYLMRRFQRWRHFKSKNLTQHQANQLMEDPAYDVGKRYGQVLEIMWFTFLYMTIIPVGAIFSCIGLIAYYWVDKYNLLRRSSIKNHVSGDLISLTLAMLEFTLPLRVGGQILFDYQLRNQISIITWVYLGISIIFILLPAELLVNLLSSERFLNQKMDYYEAQKFFHNTYKMVNILFNRLDQDHAKIIQEKTENKKNRINLYKQIRQRQNIQPFKEERKILR